MNACPKEIVIPRRVDVPSNHRVLLEVELPAEYPIGATDVTLIFKTADPAAPRPNRLAELYGKGAGKVWMADDFDAPLADFAEYS